MLNCSLNYCILDSCPPVFYQCRRRRHTLTINNQGINPHGFGLSSLTVVIQIMSFGTCFQFV